MQFYKVWIVKHDKLEGFPVGNIFYRRSDAMKFAREIRGHIPGRWRVLQGSLKVESHVG